MLAPPVEDFLRQNAGFSGYSVRDSEGQLLLGDAWVDGAVPATAQPEFHSLEYGGVTYRVAVLRGRTGAGELVVSIADGSDPRQQWAQQLLLRVLLPNLVLPYNRLVIIGFALAVVLLTWLLLNRTRLGLNVRAVTQNRNMAACCGVPTGRVDMLAFGLGSGIAGLGGVALSQIGNVGPDLGQSYIIDSFLVVVLGGVGQLAGSVMAAFGLGIANKILEPQIGAVLGKILILALIILFIQKRPQGLFALKGRVID